MSKPKALTAASRHNLDYRSLFNMLPNGYFICNAAEPHIILEANEAHYAMADMTKEIIGKPLYEVYPDVSEKFQQTGRSDLHDSIDRIIETGKPEKLKTYRYDIPDNKGGFLVRFWKSMHYPVCDDAGNVIAVLVSSQDVTTETINRNELKYRQWQLEETLGMGLIGTWQLDLDTRLVVADKNLASLFGVDAKLAHNGIPLETFTNAIHPDDRDRVVASIQKAMEHKSNFNQEYRTFDVDGNMRWVLARGKIETDPTGSLQFPGVLIDVTDRKHAEELTMYQALIAESIDDAVITIDTKGMITGWNHGAQLMFGYTEKQAVGKASEAILQLDKRHDRSVIRKKAYSGGSWRGNLRYHHKDGHKVEVMASVSALRDPHGMPIGIVSIMQDMTELARAQSEAEQEKLKIRSMRQEARQLKRQNEDLVALNRTKDEFIALTSHQLRTPATGTKQYLGMLLEGYAEPLGPRQRSFVQSAYDCNERQLRVVDDILRVAQVDLDKVVLRLQPTDICTFLRQIVDEQSGKFERRDHKLIYERPSECGEVELDRDRLRMALDNIIDNADKYTEPGKNIFIRVTKEAKHIVIEVEDEGVGIDESDFAKLFQKFSRIDNPLSVEVGGSGLGLYWSKRIILMHGGDISVRSKLGQGTTFSITLPISKTSLKASKPKAQTVS